MLQEQLKQAEDMTKVRDRLKGGVGERNRLEAFGARISRLTQEIAKGNARRQGLYENFVSGMLDETEYQYAKQEYDKRMAGLNRELDEARSEKEQFEAVFSGGEWLKNIHTAAGAEMLTDEMIRGLVKIYEDTRVEVVLNYSEDREKLEAVLKELEAEYGDC